MPTRPLSSAALIALVASAALFPASAKEHRSREVTREFQREHPCPSTGMRSGRCPGYIRDHSMPLACGGPDAGVARLLTASTDPTNGPKHPIPNRAVAARTK
jgi:hypothetical protein